MVLDILLQVALILIGTAIVFRGSSSLEESSEELAVYYGLPPVVQGAVIVAIGSSFPELSTAVLSTMIHGEFNLGVSAIVGSAIFNILVIPAASKLASPSPLKSSLLVVYKEGLFYMLSVSLMMLTFCLAIIYHPSPDQPMHGTMTRGMMLLPLGLYALYVFTQYQDSRDYTPTVEPTDIVVWKSWLRMLFGLAMILAGVEALVRGCLALGDRFEIPSFFWGATVVAAATSIPDLLASVRAARHDNAETSLSNALGSNTFDLLIALPVGVIIAGHADVDFSIAAPMMGALTIGTVVLFTLIRTQMELDRTEAIILLTGYVGYCIWIALVSFGVL